MRRSGQFIVKRVASALATLVLLSLITFTGAQVLPGNPGRAILGLDASDQAVAALNHELGYDRPVWERYFAWVGGLLQGDLGTSYAFQQPVTNLIAEAGANSLKLAAVAVIVIVPASIFAGIFAARRAGRPMDNVLTLSGMALSVVPEFVMAICLILLLAVAIPLFPLSATAPSGSGFWTEVYHLILPALALMAGLYGYIMRIVRANAITAYRSEYVRTARLKGLSPAQVTRRHVVRNAATPSLIVIAMQMGYMLGGLVVIEKIFNYPGLGLLMLNAGTRNDFPVLQASVLLIGVVYLVLTLMSDLLQTLLDPRLSRRTA